MKLKLAIIYGILIWILVSVITIVLNTFVPKIFPYHEINIPITIIIIVSLFGIFYIRNFNENEVKEGFLVGIIFFSVDLILDLLLFILPKNNNILIENYPMHILSMFVLIMLITILLGYLAHMKIELN